MKLAKVDLVHCRHTHIIKFHLPALSAGTLYIYSEYTQPLHHQNYFGYELTYNDY